MKRVNGFLNIDGYFIKNYKTKYPKELISKIDDNHYTINIDGTNCFFKKTKYPYTELIAYELATYLGIEATPYDLALFQNMYGVISKDFKKANCEYVSGQDILFKYARMAKNIKSLENMGLISNEYNQFPENAPYSYNINNLEVIWQALDQRYNGSEDIKSVMNQIVLYFIFNILSAQSDGMAQNWVLEESDTVKMVPLFDNELCFKIDSKNGYPKLNLCTNFNDVGKGSYKILDEFLKVSSTEYIELFICKYKMLSLDSFLEILQRVEEKIECVIPEKIKKEYIDIFMLNMHNIETVLNDNLANKRSF